MISVIIPVHNGAHHLPACVGALPSPGDVEVIVVDDASTDRTFAVAASLGARVIRLERNAGPAAARNHGARHAAGDVLLFLDADVTVADGALDRILGTLEARPDVAAMFGSYDASPSAPGLVSGYRNLLHHFVHQNGSSEASTFWAGCGAIRREAFDAVGGFDELRYPSPSIEDIELGYRLRAAGYRILLDKDLQCTHHKRWTLSSMIWTDLRHRAVPWSELLLASGHAPDDLNISLPQRASVALVGVAALATAVAPFERRALKVAVPALGCVIVLNRGLFGFLARRRGVPFALACLPLHLLHLLTAGLGYVVVRIRHPHAALADRP